jgi:hypothetical protein
MRHKVVLHGTHGASSMLQARRAPIMLLRCAALRNAHGRPGRIPTDLLPLRNAHRLHNTSCMCVRAFCLDPYAHAQSQ